MELDRFNNIKKEEKETETNGSKACDKKNNLFIDSDDSNVS